jgi:hypothetical protein
MKTAAQYASAEERARFRRMPAPDQDLFRQFRQNASWYHYWGKMNQKRVSEAWRRKALQAARGLVTRGYGALVRQEWREMFKTELPV